MSRRAKLALWLSLAVVGAYVVLPSTEAGATTFHTTISCTSTQVCGTVTSPTPGTGATVTAAFVGGTTTAMIFSVQTNAGANVTNVVGDLNTGGTASNVGTNAQPIFTGLNGSTSYVSTLDVTWNDDAVTTTSSTTSTTVAGGSTTSSSSTSSTSSTSTSSTTSTTTSTTTTTVPLPRGPGNGAIAPRPEGNVTSGADAAAVRGSERVDVAVVRSGTVQTITWNGSSWSAYQDLGLPSAGVTGDPSIVSWAPGRLDVFVRGGDNKLWQRFSTDGGTTWSNWLQPVGTDGTLASSPDAETRGPGLIDVFVVGTDGHIYQRWWDGTQWNGWLDQGTPSGPGIFSGSHPTAISRDGTHVDIFVEGGDKALWQKDWDGSQWSAWFQPVNNGTLASSPDATAWDPTNIVVFVVGTDSHMYALPFGTGGWGGWTRLAGGGDVFVNSPGADSRGSGRFDVFAPGTDSVLYQIWQ